MAQSKGKNFLKVTGILMIIGGAITIIVAIVGLISGIAIAGAAAATVEADYETAVVGSAGASLIVVSSIIALIGGVLELIAGIIGVKNCDRPEKSVTCIVWGIIVLVLQIVSLILSFSNGGGQSALTIISSIIFGLAVPVLYLVGAFLNKKNS